MAYVESAKPIATKGIGRPDYTGEQWQAKTIKRFEIHEKEALKRFAIVGSATPSPFVWIGAPLAVGVPTYLIDTDTGIAMPYTVLAGYTFEILYILSSFTQNHRIFTEFETFLLAEAYNDALHIYYENEVIGLDTKYRDPFGLLPHFIAYGGTNLGVAAMSGSAEVIGILHDLSTEVPTSKTIRCKWCGNTTSTALTTVEWTCPKCGKLNLYYHCPSSIKGGK